MKQIREFLPEYAVKYTHKNKDADAYVWFIDEKTREQWIIDNISIISHLERIYRPNKKKRRLTSSISEESYNKAYMLKDLYTLKTVSELIEDLIKKEFEKLE